MRVSHFFAYSGGRLSVTRSLLVQREHRAFTLIELLIVVAIIAILAAIAVPNFMEAQVRSKVSRVKNDMRSIATGMETYRVDNNRYMMDYSDIYKATGKAYNAYDHQIWRQLTTPIAYLTAVPKDAFGGSGEMFDAASNTITKVPNQQLFEYHSKGWINDCNQVHGFDKYRYRGEWIMTSPGPDKRFNWASWVMFICDPKDPNYGYFTINRVYDPSNGTVSIGDIVRWGP